MPNISTLATRLILNAENFDSVANHVESRYRKLGSTLANGIESPVTGVKSPVVGTDKLRRDAEASKARAFHNFPVKPPVVNPVTAKTLERERLAEQARLEQKVQRVRDRVATPLEKRHDRIKELRQLRQTGAMDDKTYKHAMALERQQSQQAKIDAAERVRNRIATPHDTYRNEMRHLTKLRNSGALSQKDFIKAGKFEQNKLQDRLAALAKQTKASGTAARFASREWDALQSVFSLTKVSLVGLIVAGITFAATVLPAMIHRSLTAAANTHRLAVSIGDTASNIMAFQHSLMVLGVDSDIAGDALGNLAQTVENAKFGIDPAAAKSFEELGLSIDELSKQKPTQQFRSIASSIAKLETEEMRAAKATEIFGDKASALLPVIKQGSKGLEELADESDRYGKRIDGLDAQKVIYLETSFKRLQSTVETLFLKVGIKLIPVMLKAADMLEKSYPKIEHFIDLIDNVATVISRAFTIASQVANEANIAFITIMSNMLTVLDYVATGFVEFAKTAATALAKIVPVAAKELAELTIQLQTVTEKIGKSNADMQKAIEENKKNRVNIFDGSFTKKSDAFVSDLENLTNERLSAMSKADKEIAIAFKQRELMMRSKRVIEENLTPLDKFNNRMKELNQFLQYKGKAGWDDYAKAVSRAVNELEEAYHLSNIALPSVAQRGSSEAVSNVNKAQIEYQLKNRETPQERLERIQKSALIVNEQVRDYARTIAAAVQQTATQVVDILK